MGCSTNQKSLTVCPFPDRRSSEPLRPSSSLQLIRWSLEARFDRIFELNVFKSLSLWGITSVAEGTPSYHQPMTTTDQPRRDAFDPQRTSATYISLKPCLAEGHA